jgi:hypothetical protein
VEESTDVCFTILFQNLHGWTKERHEKPPQKNHPLSPENIKSRSSNEPTNRTTFDDDDNDSGGGGDGTELRTENLRGTDHGLITPQKH